MKVNKIAPEENPYLQILANIAIPPRILHFIGSLPKERTPSVAIVGTRKPTSYGKEVTLRLASDLARRGVTIVSGLALGVDGLAHQATLDAGGRTIAVLGNGLPEIYPSRHRSLAEQIIRDGGAIMSEYGDHTPGLPFQFLERNRLVSGLSDAIVITEAALRSGTMSTAAHALEQGKDIFVVPGNITSPMSAGCNALLRRGAIPVTDARDILEVIAPSTLEPQVSLPLGSTPDETTLIKLLQMGVRDGDELLQKSKLKAPEYTQALTMLELAGIIRGLGANQWTLR
ncbi:MAG TPA: DNA-processing protein DprA [Candidatus Saccharimonadaceae bacterium]|nr:DNA-processing protein DprA [Candidatus Saccharimonadaceae bacterium]